MRRTIPARIGHGETMQTINRKESWAEMFRRMIDPMKGKA